MNAPFSADQSRLESRKPEPLVSEADLDKWIHAALRKFVSRGRKWSVKQLSNASGVPDRMIESAIAAVDSEDFRPLKRCYFWSIAKALGAPFMTEMLKNIGQGAFDFPKDMLPSPDELVADCANDVAEIAHHAVGGHFDGHERQALSAIGQREVVRGMEMIAAAESVA